MQRDGAQPTPGPWHSEGDRVVTGDGLVVADVRHAGTWITGANSRLLASAPDLLAVVRAYLDLDRRLAAGSTDLSESTETDDELWLDCRDMAEAALAKATGRETPEQQGRLALMLAGPELLEAAVQAIEAEERLIDDDNHRPMLDAIHALRLAVTGALGRPAEVQP